MRIRNRALGLVGREQRRRQRLAERAEPLGLGLAALEPGGAYLVFLGVQAWRASFKRVGEDDDWMLGPARRFTEGSAFRQGFVTNVLNPKLVVFFISVLPSFASDDGSFFAQVMVLTVVFEALSLVWLLGYGYAVARVGEAMRAPRVRHFLERLTGTVLIALGIRVAWDGAREI